MKTFEVTVTSTVRVTLDETAFTQAFFDEFTAHFFPYDTLEEHAEHIGQLAAREVAEFGHDRKEFVEGYGPIGHFGIKARVVSVEVEAEEEVSGFNPHGSGPVPIEPREV